MSSTPGGPATARIAASTASGLGEVKTSPATAALSIPGPTYPACAGSCPLPPPEIRATRRSRTAAASARTTTVCPGRRASPGYAATSPWTISSTTASGPLISFFIAGSPPPRPGRHGRHGMERGAARPVGSCRLAGPNTTANGRDDDDHRVDRPDLEPDPGVHEDQPGLRALLCGNLRRAVPGRAGASL